MKVIEGLQQGTPAWHEFRAKHFNASEAAAMMGVSPYMTRNELLALKKFGIQKEVSDHQQALFDAGHATEALARPIIEQILGEDLYPIVATDDDDWLSASFDGITIGDDITFEHKKLNQALVAQIQAGELEPEFYWQVEQQLLISSARVCIFVCSDGTEENMHRLEYRAVPGRAEQLVAGWKQFEKDLETFELSEAAPAVIGRAPDELPALRIEVTGMVTASNLDAFKENALAVFKSINRNLSTDADFADAEKTVKWCKSVEDKLDAAKEHALSQTASIDLLFKTINGVKEEARATRLEMEKMIKARKDAVRVEIQQAAQQKLFDHLAALDKRLGGRVRLPNIAADFAGVMKGKKTVASLQDACDTELARLKIESSAVADAIQTNLASLDELAADHVFLFNDLQQIIMKSNDDFVLLVKSRISEHKVKEEQRLEAERERIRQEEAARLTREQAAQKATEAPASAAPANIQRTLDDEFSMPAQPDTGGRIKLGDINARLAPLSISAEGLATLGFHPTSTDRAAKLYNAGDFSRICAALVDHINKASTTMQVAA